MLFTYLVLPWLVVVSGTVVTDVNAVAVATKGICCRLKWNLGLSYPPFIGYCKKIARFDPNGVTYDCGGNGFVMYSLGTHEPTHPKGAILANFEVKTNENRKNSALLVMLHCDPLENPGLHRNFIVGGDPYFCESTVGLTFGPLLACAHPRVSYRMTPTRVVEDDCRA